MISTLTLDFECSALTLIRTAVSRRSICSIMLPKLVDGNAHFANFRVFFFLSRSANVRWNQFRVNNIYCITLCSAFLQLINLGWCILPPSKWCWWLFPRLRGFRRMFDHSFPECAFFLKWRLARAQKFHSLCQDQSTVAQRAETTVAKCSLTSCVWARLRIGSHITPGQRHSQPTPNQGCMRVRCNLPPAHLAERPGSFTCHCGNNGVERTPNKSQHTQLTMKKKILPPLLPGFELATFRSRVRRSYQQVIPAPSKQLVSWCFEPSQPQAQKAQVIISTCGWLLFCFVLLAERLSVELQWLTLWW